MLILHCLFKDRKQQVNKTFPPVRVKCAWAIAWFAAGLACAQDSVLHIKLVAGDSAQYSPGAHAKPLIVEITDANGRPVAGARVSFQVPEEGPGGVFANGLRTDIAITDSGGRAAAHGLQLNHVAGSFGVRITAAKEQARAGTIARQSIGSAGAQAESADRNAPPPVSKPPAPAAAPLQAAPVPPAITVPATIATDPVKVPVQQPRQQLAVTPRAPVEPTHGVPTIIVTQKSAKSVAEIGAGGGHKSHKKWIWIGLAAAGGAGAAFANKDLIAGVGHNAPSSPSAAGVSAAAVNIGTPTITIGKP